jgi:hypothetical protein
MLAMFRWLTRFFLLRFLPRRLLPIITVIELVRLVRGMRRTKVAVNEPIDSRTAPPPRISPPAGQSVTPARSADQSGPST